MPAKKKSVPEAAAPTQATFTVRIPGDLHWALRVVAADVGLSLNEQITDIFTRWWAEKPDRDRYEALRKSSEGRRKPA